jgi:cellulose synthase/poly-beta-1,6-N-acetylglucosamine synthase-like glycosyltransferase
VIRLSAACFPEPWEFFDGMHRIDRMFRQDDSFFRVYLGQLAVRTGCQISSMWGGAMKKISVVVPFLNEEENLPELYSRLKAVFDGRSEAAEFLFVDDGSTDGSVSYLTDKKSLFGRCGHAPGYFRNEKNLAKS